MMFNLRAFIQYQPERADFSVFFVGDDPNGGRSAGRLSFEKISRHGQAGDFLGYENRPDMRSFIQSFVDEAHRVGIRPSAEVADSDAQRKHLADMRALVFNFVRGDDGSRRPDEAALRNEVYRGEPEPEQAETPEGRVRVHTLTCDPDERPETLNAWQD